MFYINPYDCSSVSRQPEWSSFIEIRIKLLRAALLFSTDVKFSSLFSVGQDFTTVTPPSNGHKWRW